MAKEITSYKTKIYWEDTDASGIVYHANYIRFMERARSQWAAELGFEQETMRTKDHQALVVANLEISYKRPAKLDDEIEVKTQLVGLRAASFIVKQTVFRDNVVLASAQVRLGFVDTTTGRPLPFPKLFLERFTPYLSTEESTK